MGNMSSNSGFLRRIDFLITVSFTTYDLQIIATLIFGAQQDTMEIQNHDWPIKKSFCCAMYAEGVVGPYNFSNEEIRGMDCYQFLDSCIQSEAQ